MTLGDKQFLKEMGIEPSSLDDPFPRPLPPPLPLGPVIPSLTENDACWLQNLGVQWDEPEAGFVPPGTLHESLTLFPAGIREAVDEVAKELGIALSEDDLDDLAQNIVVMFLDSSTGLEDVVEMYVTCPPPRPRKCRSQHFHHYVKLRVRAAVRTLLGDMVPRPGDFR